ncbi:unnamed protein product [Closterium sp. NIES-54]
MRAASGVVPRHPCHAPSAFSRPSSPSRCPYPAPSPTKRQHLREPARATEKDGGRREGMAASDGGGLSNSHQRLAGRRVAADPSEPSQRRTRRTQRRNGGALWKATAQAGGELGCPLPGGRRMRRCVSGHAALVACRNPRRRLVGKALVRLDSDDDATSFIALEERWGGEVIKCVAVTGGCQISNAPIQAARSRNDSPRAPAMVAISAKRLGLWCPADAAMPSAKAASPGATPLSRGRWRSAGERWTCGAMAAVQMGVALLLLAVAATSLILLGYICLPNRWVPALSPFFLGHRPLHPPPPPLLPLCTMDACFDFFPPSFTLFSPLYSDESLEGTKTGGSTSPHSLPCAQWTHASTSPTAPPHPPTSPSCTPTGPAPSTWRDSAPPGQPRHPHASPASPFVLHRAAIDVSLPLPPTWKHHAASLRPLPVGKRRYLLAFMGAQYLLAFMGAQYLLAFMGAWYLGTMHGSFHRSKAFKGLHHRKDIIVVTWIGHEATHTPHTHQTASLLTSPLPPSASFPPFPSPLLLSLPTSSNHPNQVLTAGAIPVVVADTRKLPFDDIIPWHRCLLVFPTSLLSRIEPTLRAITPVPPNPLSNPPVPWNRLCAPCTCYLPPSCLAPSP